MALNVTTAVFRPGFNIATASPSLVQWDQGQVLKFEGVELPSAYQVEFTNAVTVQAITMIGNENGVEIPNELLQQSFPITAYIVLHETAEDRETEYWATIYVKARQKPREETPDPEQISVIDQTIAALQEGVADAQAAANEAEAASQAVQDMGVEAETLPEGSAATVEKTVDPETRVVTLTYGIPKGAQGNKGDKGNPGETYLLAPSVDTIVKNPNTGTFIPAQIVFTVYKVVNGTSSPYRAAAIVADIFGMGMVPHYEVVNDYRLTVPINSIADTGYVACSAYGNGGIIATITIPCILDGAKGDPGEGVAPGGTTGQFLKKKSGTDYDTEWADVDPGVTSVNGKTGAVTLTASDVGAKPASYEAPVSSVNEKTGAVVLDAGDIGYDGETTYPDASVGKELGTINSALSSLSSVTEIIDTASGAIASFPDGAGLPMRSLLAQINPVQDLHGQSSPYPPGGGKNKFEITLADVKAANTIGTWSGDVYTNSNVKYEFVEQDGYVKEIKLSQTASDQSNLILRTSGLPLASGTSYIINGCPSGGSIDSYGLWAANAGYQDYGSGYTFTYDGNTAIVGKIRIASGTNCNNLVFKPMIRLASVSDATYAPYSNICPISGHTGVSVEQTGANLYSRDNGQYNVPVYATDGTATAYADVNVVWIKVNPNTKYTITNQPNSQIYYVRWIECDENKGYVWRDPDMMTTSIKTYTTRADTRYLQIAINQWDAGNISRNNWEVCIQAGEGTDYYPYESTTTTVSWQDEAGTVYGGTATYNGDGTWALVVDHAIVDLGTLTWNKVATSTAGKYRQSSANLVGYVKAVARNNELASITCETYPAKTADQTYGRTFGISINTSANVIVYDEMYSGENDSAAFTASVSGVKLAYPVVQPQTYTITTEQLLNTLYGQNNVFVDTGDVTVTYQASIKGYIDKVLGQ